MPNLDQATGGIGLHVNTNKTNYMRFNRKGAIFTLNSGPWKLVNKFTYLSSSVSSSDVNMGLAKAWIARDKVSMKWRADLSDKIKRDFFQAAVVSILFYESTT